jgi:predicted nucleotidyltransferase component of viral defense system
MIKAKEIDEKAKEFEIHTSDVQRDYVFGWLLFGIFTQSVLKDEIFLKGGNALRKGYFLNTRYSTDLDFGIPHDIDQEINKVCATVQERAGVVFVQNDIRVEEKFTATDAPLPDLKVYEVRVYFKDFYGNSKHMKLRVSMDVTRFDRVLLDTQHLPLIHPYSDAAEVACNIRCMMLEEIIATKLKCMMQRQHAPDLFDYSYSIQKLGGSLDRSEVMRALIQKTIFSRNPFSLKGILLKTAFDYYRQEWAKSVICAKQFFLSVEDAITAFIADLELLFADYSDNGYAQFAYFNAEHRATIMHAARTQTRLRMRYKGADRIVEPYSLKYMQRRDGDEREYFFAYNRSGGNNPAGMRTFVSDKVEAIENTQDTFEPQYPIELSKSGEMPEDRYLFDPNKPEKEPRTARAHKGHSSRTRQPRILGGLKYIFKCNACGKRFTRSSHDASLRAHKGKGGYQCYGTYGLYVGTKY